MEHITSILLLAASVAVVCIFIGVSSKQMTSSANTANSQFNSITDLSIEYIQNEYAMFDSQEVTGSDLKYAIRTYKSHVDGNRFLILVEKVGNVGTEPNKVYIYNKETLGSYYQKLEKFKIADSGRFYATLIYSDDVKNPDILKEKTESSPGAQPDVYEDAIQKGTRRVSSGEQVVGIYFQQLQQY